MDNDQEELQTGDRVQYDVDGSPKKPFGYAKVRRGGKHPLIDFEAGNPGWRAKVINIKKVDQVEQKKR